jgi:hypothetical protein
MWNNVGLESVFHLGSVRPCQFWQCLWCVRLPVCHFWQCLWSMRLCHFWQCLWSARLSFLTMSSLCEVVSFVHFWHGVQSQSVGLQQFWHRLECVRLHFSFDNVSLWDYARFLLCLQSVSQRQCEHCLECARWNFSVEMFSLWDFTGFNVFVTVRLRQF